MHTVFQLREGLSLPKSYDTSTKRWEIKNAHYVFDLETRERYYKWQIIWEHRRYYKTKESALQALHDLRRDWYALYDSPEFIHPGQDRHPPRRTVNRYKLVERNL